MLIGMKLWIDTKNWQIESSEFSKGDVLTMNRFDNSKQAIGIVNQVTHLDL